MAKSTFAELIAGTLQNAENGYQMQDFFVKVGFYTLSCHWLIDCMRMVGPLQTPGWAMNFSIVLHIAIDAQHAARPQLHNIQIQWITVLESRSRKLISTTELNGQKQIGDCTLLWTLICFYSYMSQVCKWWSCELVHFLFAWSRHSIAKTSVFAIEILNA